MLRTGPFLLAAAEARHPGRRMARYRPEIDESWITPLESATRISMKLFEIMHNNAQQFETMVHFGETIAIKTPRRKNRRNCEKFLESDRP